MAYYLYLRHAYDGILHHVACKFIAPESTSSIFLKQYPHALSDAIWSSVAEVSLHMLIEQAGKKNKR